MFRHSHHSHVAVLCFTLLFVCGQAYAKTNIVEMLGGTPDKITLTAEEQRYIELTNAERKEKNLPELVVSPLLVKVAREKSKEMHDLKYWGHESPVKDKRTAMRRVLFHLPKPPFAMTVGENLCFCPKVMVEEGHNALMASPTHKANIVNPVYRYIGIGAFTAEDGRFWITEIFLDIDYGK
ncbi:MAG: Cysteine-rich secretory protein family protein [bacterium ADurb.Bin429]|nr:MAG: Cysteine-rich secretory protein family protein [bacterium ADurb.Bin429]